MAEFLLETYEKAIKCHFLTFFCALLRFWACGVFFAFLALKSSILAPFSVLFERINPRFWSKFLQSMEIFWEFYFRSPEETVFIDSSPILQKKKVSIFRRFSKDHSSFFVSIYLSDIVSCWILISCDLLGQFGWN